MTSQWVAKLPSFLASMWAISENPPNSQVPHGISCILGCIFAAEFYLWPVLCLHLCTNIALKNLSWKSGAQGLLPKISTESTLKIESNLNVHWDNMEDQIVRLDFHKLEILLTFSFIIISRIQRIKMHRQRRQIFMISCKISWASFPPVLDILRLRKNRWHF